MSRRVPAKLRREIEILANYQCEYCLFPAQLADYPHEPDHIIPIQHKGKTELGNLALACFPCNRRKGPNVGSFDDWSGELTRFYHPRRDNWQEHFELDNGLIRPITAIGRVTVDILQFNRATRIAERQLAMDLGLLTP